MSDIKCHSESSDCECSPSVEFTNGEMIVIHSSYDGREYEENLPKVFTSTFSEYKTNEAIDLYLKSMKAAKKDE